MYIKMDVNMLVLYVNIKKGPRAVLFDFSTTCGFINSYFVYCGVGGGVP